MRNGALILIVMFVMISQHAAAQQFKYELHPYSSIGKVTGGKCLTNRDCVNGYLQKKDKKFAMRCLTKKQAGSRIVDAEHTPDFGLVCGCLPDVKLCGYAQPQEIYK